MPGEGPQVRLLGAPELRQRGELARVDTRKAIALVAYLAAAGPPIARATLADLLWPESDEERGRSALRRTLSALRNALGTSAIVASRDAVAVAEHVDIDVTCFRSSAAGGGIESLEAAVRLYRGELLAGFSLRDSPGFDDWLREVRRRTEPPRA